MRIMWFGLAVVLALGAGFLLVGDGVRDRDRHRAAGGVDPPGDGQPMTSPGSEHP
jgi:hypothetical protein